MKTISLLLMLFSFGFYSLQAQDLAVSAPLKQDSKLHPGIEGPEKAKSELPLYLQNYKPQFPGGEKALGKFVQDKLEYPSQARKYGEETDIAVYFRIEADGSISDIRIDDNSGLGFVESATALMRQMPNWTPAIQAGRRVGSWNRIPLQFRLE